MRSQAAGQALVVGHHDHREPLLLVETPQEVVQSLPGLLVEVAGGLVGQEGPRRLDQGAGHRHPLLLAARERARPVVAALREPQLRRAAPPRAAAPPPPGRRAMSSGIITFSRAVNSGSRWWNWKTKPEGAVPEARAARSSASANTSSPPTAAVPDSGRSSVPSTCSSVDFPTPDAPMIASISPGARTVEVERPASTGT